MKEELYTAYYAVSENVADRGIEIPGIEDEALVEKITNEQTDITGKSEFVETKEKELMDKVGGIVRRISEFGGYENVSDSVKTDIVGFDIADVNGSIRLFSDVMNRLGVKLDDDELYEEFQRIYDRDTDKKKVEDRMRNRGR